MISSAENITTEELLEESMKDSPLYYIAAVVNASQYKPNHRMRYYLGAGDNTTDVKGHVFHNRKLRKDLAYFFRVFSIDSASEVCLVLYLIILIYLLLRMRFQLPQIP